MLAQFFLDLKEAKLPVSLREYLTLMEAMESKLAEYNVEKFYYLSRSCLVKDEKNLDKFDAIFGKNFDGKDIEQLFEESEIPEDWLIKLVERYLSSEEMAEINSLGGWDKLMKTFKERLEEQTKRHQGGIKMIGTAGTSPFGAYGYNPEGIRIGQPEGRHNKAVKVWDERRYKNLDDNIELGTRNIKLALRRLRRFAREGAEEELDLDNTIRFTAENGGFLDIQMVPERHNSVKVLLLFDIGGSMDSHVKNCQELFSAARTEFKHLEYFYFHNCIYERVWKDNLRRKNATIDTVQLINTYSSDFKVIFVGDAAMSPYEIMYPGGSVEHWNQESGSFWMERLLEVYKDSVWLNPIEQRFWSNTPSNQIINQLMSGRMYPMNLDGLDRAMKSLTK